MKVHVSCILACFIALSGLPEEDIEMTEAAPVTEWGPTNENCRLSVGVERDVYFVDEAIPLRMMIENIGEQAQYLLASPGGHAATFGFRFEIQMANARALRGKRAEAQPPADIPMTREGRRRADYVGSRALHELEAGRIGRATVPMLNRLFDMTVSGDYTVTAYWPLAAKKSGEKPTEVQSNTITIPVRDRE